MYNDHALLEIIGSLGVNTEHTEAVSKARRNQSNAQNQRDILKVVLRKLLPISNFFARGTILRQARGLNERQSARCGVRCT